MDPDEIKRLLQADLPDAEIDVQGDGAHFQAWIVSTEFEGLTRIQRHRRAKGPLKAEIESGRLHAISFPRTSTPEEARG